MENICVCTDPFSNHVTALVSPNRKSLTKLAEKLSKSNYTFEKLCSDTDVVKHVLKSIKDTCKRLGFARKEIPTRITLCKEEWTPDNLLTAAMKMKRKQVNEYYHEQIKQMFSEVQDGNTSSTRSV